VREDLVVEYRVRWIEAVVEVIWWWGLRFFIVDQRFIAPIDNKDFLDLNVSGIIRHLS